MSSKGAAALLFCFVAPAIALAQPAPPKAPAAPAAPAVPSASVPAVPAAPGPPAGPPGAPPTVPAASGSAPPATAPPPPDVEESKVILDGRSESTDGAPTTLPRELRRNLKAGSKLRVQDKKDGGLTIEEIVNSPIVSSSNRRESSLSAAAFVIVITAKDIKDRGYSDLSQILDDLPGMDVIRPFGDVYVKSYWRGYRPGAGADPYLVMLDGVVMNHLFYKDAQMFATFPMSNIDRVEVVYGPASAVYGPNAAMGVINVITADGRDRQEAGETGATVNTRFVYGGPQRNLKSFSDSTKIVDGTMFYTTKDWRLRLSTRIESSVLDRSIGDDFEYTKPKYYSDPRIWGQPVLDKYPDLGGSFRSPDRKQAFDGRLFYGNAEFGAQVFRLQTGYGTRYAADRYQNQTPWTTTELGVFARHTGNLSPSVLATTFVQYRQSNLSSPSVGLGRYRSDGIKFDDAGPNLVAYEAPSSAIVAQEDITISASRSLLTEGDEMTVGLGFKFQHMELSKNYNYLSNITYPLASPDPIKNATNATDPSNQYADGRTWRPAEELGAYLLTKYAFPTANAVHLGLRFDHSTLVDSSDVTFRGGYVGTFDPLTVKLLYGQAVYAPSTYDIYRATGSQVSLQEEKSQTLEANAQVTLSHFAFLADAYYVQYANPIVDGRNLDARKIGGADLGARVLFRPFQLWAYYSRYLKAEETKDSKGTVGPIGDLAKDKIWGGATFEKGPFVATLLGRFMGPRVPVVSNPLGTVPAYFTLDANVVVSHVFYEGMWLGFRVTNLLDATYSQPGMSSAGSGNTPGVFSAAGYSGSKDDFNSRLPQPRRSLFWTLGLEL